MTRAVCRLALIVLLVAPASLHAQRRPQLFDADSGHITTSRQGVAFVASAILPGAGQYYLKADRWVPFVAVEGWAWIKYVHDRRVASDLEKQYRDLAWNVARRIATSSRKDSVFTYYEAMGEWRESGHFDIDATTPGLQPEIDVTTFNGTQWRRAQALFGDREKALAYYRANAIPDLYIWSWGSSALEQEEFRATIGRSDAAFRSGTRMLGVILANHVVSAIDALVLARVQQMVEHRFRIGSTLEPAGSNYLWTTEIQIPLLGAERVRNAGTNR